MTLLQLLYLSRHATLRDEPNNGCEGDYTSAGYFFLLLPLFQTYGHVLLNRVLHYQSRFVVIKRTIANNSTQNRVSVFVFCSLYSVHFLDTSLEILIVKQDNLHILTSYVTTISSFAGLKKSTCSESEARQNEKIEVRKVRSIS